MGVAATGFAFAAQAATDEQCAEAHRLAQEAITAGHLSDARARLADCAVAGCPAMFREECTAQLAELGTSKPAAITFVLKDGEGRDLREVRVTMDGKPFADHPDGTAIPVDAGEHRFLFEATGFHRIETTVIARAGDRKRRVLIFLNPDNGSGAPMTIDWSAGPLALASPPGGGAAEPAARSPRLRRKIAFALAGAGAGVLVLGGVWSLLARSEYDHAINSECGGDAHSCSPQGIADGRTAHDRATVATIGFVAGAALLAAAATVYFTTPKQERIAVAPAVDEKSAGLALLGRW